MNPNNRKFRVALFAVLLFSGTGVVAGVKVSGRILHPASDSVQLSYNESKLAYYPQKRYAVLDKEGNFTIDFPFPSGGYIQAELQHGAHLAELMLHDNDSLVMDVDALKFDSTIHYKGLGSNVQNFVAAHTLSISRLNQYAVRIKSKLEKEKSVFLSEIEKEKSREVAFLDEHKSELPAAFTKIWLAHFTYYNYFFIQQYPQMNEMIRLRRVTDTVPVANYSVLSYMPDAFNDDMLSVPSYLLYLSGVFEGRLKASGYAFPVSVPENARKFLDSVDILAYKLLPSASGEYFIAQSLYAHIKTQPVSLTHKQLAKFKKRWPNSEYLMLLEKQASLAERLSPGQAAPDMDITDRDGKPMKLSDLKGKVVYITFWASWCKQCVGEMRSARKVKDVFNGKPVAFVNVSIDEDTTNVHRLLKHFKIDGLFSWTNGGWYAPQAVSYGVQSLPAYFLIGKDGNFAVQTPPGPLQGTELIVAISRLF